MNKMKRMLLFTTDHNRSVNRVCRRAPVLQQTAYAQNNGALTQTVYGCRGKHQMQPSPREAKYLEAGRRFFSSKL